MTKTVPTTPWIPLSMAAAVFAFAGSIIALANTSIYGHLTAAFLPQALAQDIGNLFIAPLLLVCAVMALRGSLRAYLIWLGVVAFTLYNYAIYVFSVPFGPLFPLWVAVLGLSLFALIGGLLTIDSDRAAARYSSPRTATISAWFLLGAASLFALLWLSEDIPALISGTTPQSVVDLALPTNPVHILDYVFFVPAAVISAIGLLRRHHFAFVSAPALLVLLILTCAPILITPLVQNSVNASIGMIAAISLLVLTLLTVLISLLRSIHAQESTAGTIIGPAGEG